MGTKVFEIGTERFVRRIESIAFQSDEPIHGSLLDDDFGLDDVSVHLYVEKLKYLGGFDARLGSCWPN
jgi:hypothetical protein